MTLIIKVNNKQRKVNKLTENRLYKLAQKQGISNVDKYIEYLIDLHAIEEGVY